MGIISVDITDASSRLNSIPQPGGGAPHVTTAVLSGSRRLKPTDRILSPAAAAPFESAASSRRNSRCSFSTGEFSRRTALQTVCSTAVSVKPPVVCGRGSYTSTMGSIQHAVDIVQQQQHQLPSLTMPNSHADHRGSNVSIEIPLSETAQGSEQHQRHQLPRLRWRQQQQQESTGMISRKDCAARAHLPADQASVESNGKDNESSSNYSSRRGHTTNREARQADGKQQPTCSRVKSVKSIRAGSSKRQTASLSNAIHGSKQLQTLSAIKDKTFEELQEVVQQYGRTARLTNLMAMFSRLKSVKWCSTQDKSALLQQLWQLLQGQLQHASPRHCTEALLTASKLRCSDKQLYTECLAAFVGKAGAANVRTLANAVYAVATAADTIRSDPEIRAAVECVLLPMFVRKANQAEPQGVSNVVYSAALLGFGSSSLDIPKLLRGLPRGFWKKATVQELSNTLWGAAESKQVLCTQQLQQLLDLIVTRLPEAQPLHVSTTLWAVAVMGLRVSPVQLQRMVASMLQKPLHPRVIGSMLWSIGKLGAQLPQQQVDQLLELLLLKLTAPATTVTSSDSDNEGGSDSSSIEGLGDSSAFSIGQAISNTLHGIATMKRTILQHHLEQLLNTLTAGSVDCNPQCLSNTLWAAAVMKSQVKDEHLEALLSGLAEKLSDAESQSVANALWAASSLVPPYFAGQLFSKEAVELIVQQHVPHMNAQELSNIAVACATVGHLDRALMLPLLDRFQQLLPACGSDSRPIRSAFPANDTQAICNIIWACVVLDLSDQALQLQQLAAHCLPAWPSFVVQDRMQLYQLHMWLIEQCGQVEGLLSASAGFSRQHIEECERAWVHVVGHMSTVSHLQQSVYEAVLQIPELQEVRLEVTTADKLWSMDIAAVTAQGHKLAVEVDGPHHHRRPDGRANGSTVFRNKALMYRGYVVVEVPWMEWNALGSADMSGKVDYLRCKVHNALIAAGVSSRV